MLEQLSTERAKLIRLNPHLPCRGGARANTPLKAGTRVNLTSQALKNMVPNMTDSTELDDSASTTRPHGMHAGHREFQ